ncbi:MAG: nitrite/sulfite reductase [Acidimicrobiales bacterium]|nr:nitrite/sulfite reductase [Acidimicrobiales bacterium]
MALTEPRISDVEIISTPGPVLDPEIAADIAKFRTVLDGYLAGDVDEDTFRVFRLTNGIYGQRQGGRNQMVRVRVPYGAISANQLDTLGFLVDNYSRGWGHITTRQNLQFHYVQLEQVPEVLEHMGAVGLTSREACGDTIRNVQGCHLAGACPFEVLDISAWAEAANNHFLRNPLGQRLPRKFKINFSGCATDCGQAMFNDAGVIAVTRTLDDGTVEAGFRVFVAGGLGTSPHPALALEEFTPKEELLPTLESILRVFEQTGERDNKLRARMKWVVDTLGWEETQRRILKTRKFLLASATWPGGIPAEVLAAGDAPAGLGAGATPTAVGQGVAVSLRSNSAYAKWESANVVRGVAKGTVSAYAWCELGDITAAQFRGMAAIVRKYAVDVRLSNRQNFIIRDLDETQLPSLFDDLIELGMAEPGAELSRDVVSCPGADTCGLAVTQSRGLAKSISEALEAEGLADIGGVRFNISGCPNSCGQHHIADIGFFGAERRAHGQSAPGYQMLLGGHVGQEKIHFGDKALRLPAKRAAEASVRVLRRFVGEREAGEAFRSWMDRVGGAREIAKGLKDLDEFPTPEADPSYYIDFDEAGPYVAEVGQSECAT